MKSRMLCLLLLLLLAQENMGTIIGVITGLNNVQIINESAASAIAYGLDKSDSMKNVLVFDLSDGTFNVSLVTIDGGVFKVVATSGGKHLGDEDFDQAVMEHLLKFHQRRTDEIVLVGDSTRIPKIQQLVKEFLNGKEPLWGINLDEVVAYGAAVHAGVVSGEEDAADVLLLPAEPAKKSQNFTAASDNQSVVTIEMYEGEHSLIRDNHRLGTFSKDTVRGSMQHKNVSLLNPKLQGRFPPLGIDILVPGPLPPAEFEDQEMSTYSDAIFLDNVNLQWQTWTGSLPNGAIFIDNAYTQRRDYICKSVCHSGFYSPSLGPYCRFPYYEREYKAHHFQILANKNNFELLEWKEDYYGSVPPNSIGTCTDKPIYVGKNRYGLGKVDRRHNAFFLPYEGYEYWYKTYDVLAIKKLHYSQHVYNVNYFTDNVKIIQGPPENFVNVRVINNECQNVKKTVTWSKTTRVEHTWEYGHTNKVGVTGTIKAKIPIIGSMEIQFTMEETREFKKGTTVEESVTLSASVELKVKPNHQCTVRVQGRKFGANIPYSAILSRTYSSGQWRWTSIKDKYHGLQYGEIQAVIDRCEPLPNAKPCP